MIGCPAIRDILIINIIIIIIIISS